MAFTRYDTQNSLLISTENLYQIKEARYQFQKMHEALKEARWHLHLGLRHFKSIQPQGNTTHMNQNFEDESYFEETYENYMAQNCTCDRQDSDCQCMTFEQFCEHHICELHHELEEFQSCLAYEEKLENF
jgi:hypothetical protein